MTKFSYFSLNFLNALIDIFNLNLTQFFKEVTKNINKIFVLFNFDLITNG